MKPLFNEAEFQTAKALDKLPCKCYQCNGVFHLEKRKINEVYQGKRAGQYCSIQCRNNSQTETYHIPCGECGEPVLRKIAEVRRSKSGKAFCNQSCAASYNNKNKKHGTRRSKLEVWLEKQLTELFPLMEIHYNRSDTINSELDIYIPSLSLAFELNGVFHYEAIFGEAKLAQIQNNDERKFQACLEEGIELCIIDSSGLKYFKPKNAQKYLDIILKVIFNKSKN